MVFNIGFVVYLIGYIMAILVVTDRITVNSDHKCNGANVTQTSQTIFKEPCAAWILPTLMVM